MADNSPPTSSPAVERDSLLVLTADVTAAYLSNNPVPTDQLAELVRTIHESLHNLGRHPSAPAPAPKPSAVAVRKSITREALVSFEDGRPYRMLRRHLKSVGLTPELYRAKWGLPNDYPMTAPTYSERRSALAKSLGLGVKTAGRRAGKAVVEAVKEVPGKAATAAEKVANIAGLAEDAPKRRGPGRPRKTKA
jgi:predicted transcriptional regulator